MAYKDVIFFGEVPKMHSDILKDGYALRAIDVNLHHGDLRPYPCPEPFCSKQFDIKSLYSYPDCECLAFPVDTDVIRIVDESGDLLLKNDGTTTQVATVLDACAGIWCEAGVPCPTAPPDVSHGTGDACTSTYSSFRYRFVHKFGWVGAPSPATSIENVADDVNVVVGGFQSSHNCITHILVERAVHGLRTGEEAQTAGDWAWFVIGTIPIGGSFSGSASSFDLGYTLPEKFSRAFPPTPGMRGAAILKTGAVVGYIGKKVFISEPGLPYAYSGDADFMADHTIVDVVQHGDDVYVVTEGYPIKIVIRSYDNVPFYDYVTIPEYLPCTKKESIVSVGDGILYATKLGFALIIDESAKLINHQTFFIDDFDKFKPEQIRAAAYGGRYFFFNDESGYEVSFASRFFNQSDVSHTVRITTVKPDILTNAFDGELLFVEGGNVFRWAIGDTKNPCGKDICCPYTFARRVTQSADDRRYTAAKITFGRDSIENITGYKFFKEDCGEERLIYERSVDHCRPYRLPRQYRATETYYEVDGCATIREVHHAESIAELGRA